MFCVIQKKLHVCPAVGVDMVEVARFGSWLVYDDEQLLKVFTPYEVAEFSQKKTDQQKMQFLASRFAVKEAFYKALSCFLVQHDLTVHKRSLRELCPLVGVAKATWEVPVMRVDWDKLSVLFAVDFPDLEVAVSLSHEKAYAIAHVSMMLS